MIHSKPSTLKEAAAVITAYEEKIVEYEQFLEKLPTYYDDQYRFHEYELQMLRDIFQYCLSQKWFQSRLEEIKRNMKFNR